MPSDFSQAKKKLAWIDMITLANHEDSVVTASYGFLATRWGVSKHTAYDWIQSWIGERSIERLGERSEERNGERFFVVNYAKYQKPMERSTERRRERKREREGELKKQVSRNNSWETTHVVVATDVALTPAQYAEKFFAKDPATMKAEADFFTERGATTAVIREQFLRFLHYWMELTPGGKKQRWQTQKTFEIRRRLVTWFDRIEQSKKSSAKPHVHIS